MVPYHTSLSRPSHLSSQEVVIHDVASITSGDCSTLLDSAKNTLMRNLSLERKRSKSSGISNILILRYWLLLRTAWAIWFASSSCTHYPTFSQYMHLSFKRSRGYHSTCKPSSAKEAEYTQQHFTWYYLLIIWWIMQMPQPVHCLSVYGRKCRKWPVQLFPPVPYIRYCWIQSIEQCVKLWVILPWQLCIVWLVYEVHITDWKTYWKESNSWALAISSFMMTSWELIK